jgi:hypothetical protein
MRILYFFIVITFFYSLFVYFIEPIPQRLSQSQIQENTIKAENYIFNNDSFYNVIIGTSLSSRLNFESLNNVKDLTFSGLSIYDGLNILLQSNNKPNKIFIEVNFIFRNIDDNFSRDLFTFPNYFFKKNFKILRSDKTPIPLLGANISNLIKTEKFDENKTNISIINGYSEQMGAYYKVPTDSLVYLKRLKKIINLLQMKGFKIHFIEIPVSYNNSNQNYYNYIRETLIKNFKNVDYIKPDLTINWETTDGLHLSKSYANKFTKSIIYYFK